MIKKLLLLFCLLFSLIAVSQNTITMTTTSNSTNWSPQEVINSGGILTWVATNADIGILTEIENDPTFNFIANVNNLPVSITVTSTDDFAGLTRLYCNQIELTEINIDNASELIGLQLYDNNISTINLLNNSELNLLWLAQNNFSTLDVSAQINAQTIFAENQASGLTFIDFGTNDLLLDIKVHQNQLPTAVLDKIINDLDDAGLSDGRVIMDNNSGLLSSAAQPAYDNLDITKGWNIDIAAPLDPVSITFTTTSTLSSWSPSTFTNTGNLPTWSVIGGVIVGDPTTNSPVIDLSGNPGTAIITCTADDGFAGLSTLWVSDREIVTLDVSSATNLTSLSYRDNDVSDQIDISPLTSLSTLYVFNNNLTDLDILSNANLTLLSAENNQFSSDVVNKIVNDLDTNGLTNGVLRILGNSPLTMAAQPSYDNLIANGWTIDVSAPINPSTETITFTTTSTLSNWNLSDFTNTGNLPTWDVVGGVIVGDATTNDPVIDLSGNPGSALITCTSTDGFAGLLSLGVSDRDIVSLDVSSAVNLTNLNYSDNNVSSLIDISTLTNLSTLYVFNNNLTELDILTNTNLTLLSAENNLLPSVVLDKIVNDLDTNGLSNGTLRITGNDGLTASSLLAYNNLISNGWTIDVAAPTPDTGPSIQIVGNGVSISNGNTPDVADGTDFGQVSIGSSVPQIISIQNIGDSDLTVSLAGLFPSVGDGLGYSLTPLIGGGGFPPPPNVIIAAGGSFDLQVSFAPVILGTQNTLLGISSDDPDDPNYSIYFIAEGIAASSGIIDVQGNGESIVNGDLTPSVGDDTDFGQVENGMTKTTTFTIYNNDLVENLTIDDIDLSFGSAAEFTISNISDVNGAISLPFDILPTENITFDVVFSPITEGTYNAAIEILNSETNENPFQFAITGDGVLNVVSGDIMITQYYNGAGGSNWIEVVNVSDATIAAGTYFLARYDQGTNLNLAPSDFIAIPELIAEELLLFNNSAATLPVQANLGVLLAEVITTTVCDFGGNDVILISSTSDATCYDFREDEIGDIGGWPGTNISYIRGGNSSEVPELNFDVDNWLSLSPTGDVNVATGVTNVMLGNQNVGETIWNGTWSNASPDETRNAVLSGTYTALNGNIDAYNLTIDTGVDLNFNNSTTNSVILDGDLTVNGTFTIGDQESLVMYNNGATILGNITKFENSTTRNSSNDVTYWSSSVTNATIENVFAGVSPSRIWYYDQSLTQESVRPINANDPTSTYWDVWQSATGLMTAGFGYAAEGLTGSSAVHSVSFTGIPNNGIVQFDVWEWPDGDIDNDFNLIGNPYPSAIDMDDFLELNGTINGVIWPEIYLWTHTNDLVPGVGGNDFLPTDYAIRNIGGGTGVAPGADPLYNIGSGQGFMIRASEGAGGLIQFSNAMRIPDANDQFFKSLNSKNSLAKKGKNKNGSSETDRIWLNLTSDNGGFNQMLIVFTERASLEIDRGYDTRAFANDKPLLLYSNIEGGKYAIQGLGEFDKNEHSIEIGIDVNVAPRNLTIGIDHSEGKLREEKIYLVDNYLNVTHDLQKSDYTFSQSDKGEFKDRFTLKFTKSNAGGNGNGNGRNAIVISNSFDNLKVDSDETVKNAKLYDIFGRLVVEKNPNNKSFLISTEKIKSGTVLILKTTMDDGTVISKKTIKY